MSKGGQDNIYLPVISNDGKKIAYGKEKDNSTHLYVCNFDGTNKIEYVDGAPYYWLPDNQRIVYNNDGNLYTLDTSSSNTEAIPHRYKWSHDLQRIAYYNENDYLVLMNADESNKVVTDWNDWERRVQWSYDGEYLLSGMNLLDKYGNYIRTLRETD